MQLILGLGNPGAEYEGTRHNVGFELLDLLATRLGRPFIQRGRSLVARGEVGGRPFVLAKPTTFMNRSGRAARDLVQELAADPAAEAAGPLQLLVLCDDFHLPLGKMRCRLKGSSGGQNGLASVIEMLPDHPVPRLRLGIGEPSRMPTEVFVLKPFKRAERPLVDEMLQRATNHLEDWLGDGDLEALMNKANVPPA